MPASRAIRRRVVVAAVLAVGWTAAVAIALLVPEVEEDPAVYEMTHSRSYQRQVEVLGGKGALLADDLTRWLASLFEGKSLAYTVATFTALVALAYWAWDRLRATDPGGDG